MQLTEHFADTELGVAGVDARIVANATQLCRLLLEPIRAKFGPVAVDDGYRNAAHNAAVGGATDSQHLYEGANSAADIRLLAWTIGFVFDWIRLESGLPFDQVILERARGMRTPTCIHISYNGALAAQRREALVGETHGTGVYVRVEVGNAAGATG
jgi:hypothetical protein